MNPAVEQMLSRYTCNNRAEYERAMKEIIQEIALVGLWRARFFEHAAFYGGTALRILYQLDRFSEDLDFALLKPNPDFSLAPYNEAICSELRSYGFIVTVDTKDKQWATPIRSAFIKTGTLGEMLKIGVPKDLLKELHPEARLKIKVEVDTHPPPAYRTETHFLVTPVNVGIRAVALEDIFAGKMHALLFREWKGRVKGRDWYDWLWLMRQKATLNLQRLAIHMQEGGVLEKNEKLTLNKFKKLMQTRIDTVDLERLKADIRPFTQDPLIINAWSKEMLTSFVEKMDIHE